MEFVSFSASLIQEVRVCLLPGVSPELLRRCYTARQHKATLASWEIGQGKTIPRTNQTCSYLKNFCRCPLVLPTTTAPELRR